MATDLPAIGIRRYSETSATDVTGARWQPSPNFGERRGGARVDMVVIHYTAMQDAASAVGWLCDPTSEVSAHYLIGEDGEVVHMVDEAMRAWHAGASFWGGVEDVNSRSIGIELDNDGSTDFAEPQMQSLETLLVDIVARHAIPPERVVGHSDVSPGRKIDPGPRFDWRRLAAAGLSVWPGSDQAPGDFYSDAAAFGYLCDEDETTRAKTLASFRLRFRPGASGPLGTHDAVLMADLARRFPVDPNAAQA